MNAINSVEIEGGGLDYERFALEKLFKRMVKDHQISTVLEIPAKGEKAMPSIYSIALSKLGCNVTLVNGEIKSKWAWRELDLPVSWIDCDDINHSGFEGASYDLVWNFMALAQSKTKQALLQEMMRLSRRYVFYVGVNKFNPGFLSHRTVHRIAKVPWNHGDVDFMNPFYVTRYMRNAGLKIIKTGVVDTPPFPDSIGFRDMKLHRKNVDLNKIDWDSRTIHWMKSGRYPFKIKFYYLFELLPLPFLLKMFYAHLFFVLAEK